MTSKPPVKPPVLPRPTSAGSTPEAIVRPAVLSPLPVDRAQRSRDLLHPVFRVQLEAYLRAAKAAGFEILVYETFRTPARQAWLYAQGRTRPGGKITWTLDSCHRYGFAVDMVTLRNGVPDWSGRGMTALFSKVPLSNFDLEGVEGEQVHVQLKGGQNRAVALGVKRDVVVGSRA